MSELETLGGGFEQGKRSRVRAAFGVLLLIVVSAAVVFVSVGLGKIALTEAGIAPIIRGLMLTSAAFVFGICAWVTWTLVKRKITTG